jgi:hypothetical protein
MARYQRTLMQRRRDTPNQIDLLVSDGVARHRVPEQAAVRQGFLTAGMQMITKPFEIDELANWVRSIMAEPAPKPSAPPRPG